jgi:glycosyltransferase involved in cell wall biosynthesis
MSFFVVIIPAFNCANKIRQTILSVFAQSYSNWRMIIVDDVSTDHTGDICNHIAGELGISDKISVVTRTEKFGETRNTYDICSKLSKDDIIIRLDGGDWITDIDCFHILDDVYSRTNAAAVWTAHRWAYTAHNISGPLDSSVSPYKQPWKSSHLKTFRRSSFDGINKANFLDDEGNWIMIACDQAIFLPMLEKAWREKRPTLFLNTCMYHYSIDLEDPELFNTLRSKNQKMSAEWVRSRGYIE